MFRKLVAKVLKSLVKLVEGEKTVIRNAEDYLTVTSTKETASRGVKVHETHEVKKNNLDDMDREEKKAYINNCLEDIGAELYVKGYKALTEILEQYETEIVKLMLSLNLLILECTLQNKIILIVLIEKLLLRERLQTISYNSDKE
jgi:hypothetical protein